MKSGIHSPILIALLIVLLGGFAAADSVTEYRVEVSTSDTVSLLRTLERQDFDVLGHNRDAGIVEIVATPFEIKLLEAMGFELKIKSSAFGDSIPAGYRDHNTILSQLQTWASTYPAICQDIDVGVFTGEGTTYEGRHIHAMKISDNVNQDEDEPRILIVSCHHAREIVTPELALYAIEQLLTNYGSDPEITAIVDNNELWIAPVWNPDGYTYCFTTYDYWRKNRTPVGSGYYGVDLNRNYPYGWNGPAGGSTSPSSDTYRGPSVASEQETKNMLALARDRHFAKQLDFHSYGQEVLYTYYYSSSFPSTLESYYSTEAGQLSQQLGYNGYKRKPSAEGEHYHWELNELGTYSFLAETHYTFQPSYSSALAEAQLVWPGIKWLMQHEIPLKGHVTEAGTGNPIEADISIAGINYTQGEIRRCEDDYGRFHYFLPAGSYSVTFSASGFNSRTVQASVTNDKSTTIETQLGPRPVLSVSGRVATGQTLNIDFDYPAGAGQQYTNAVSYIDNGITFNNGVHYPIGVDNLLKSTAGKYPGWQGTLDASGHASGSLTIPTTPGLVGATFYMAYIVYPVTYQVPTDVSAAIKMTIEE